MKDKKVVLFPVGLGFIAGMCLSAVVVAIINFVVIAFFNSGLTFFSSVIIWLVVIFLFMCALSGWPWNWSARGINFDESGPGTGVM